MFKKRDIKEGILKIELLNRIKYILSDYNYEFNELTTISLSNKDLFLGNIKLFDLNKLDQLTSKLSSLLDEYGKNSYNTEKVESCCSQSYHSISFKVNI
ncbi:MAG: hypothetical protein LBB45_06820 [Methanobrevibacter sp.]|jgi:hypothetical protein|nr:hypothetical protein [Candidatus Methanovirga basalitermitum]